MSSSGERRKTDNNKKKKEAEKRTDETEATKLNQRNFNKESKALCLVITPLEIKQNFCLMLAALM